MRPDGASGRPTGREDRPLLSPILGKGRDFETGETGQQDIMRGNDVADTNVGGRRQERRKSVICNERLACTADFSVLVRGSTGSVLAQRRPSTASRQSQAAPAAHRQPSPRSYGALDRTTSQERINQNLRRDAPGGGAACVVSEFAEEAGHSIGAPSGVNTTKAVSTSSDTALSRLHIEEQMPAFMRNHRVPFAISFAVLINLVDACAFGSILFPGELRAFNVVGISSFLVSMTLVQLIFNLRSEFRCALGTSMAENIPFLHAIATGVVGSVVGHGGSVESALPSVMVAYALSAVVTGVAFYLLGSLQLGQLLHFFPRHIIIGLVGGFGMFLLVSALEVSTGLTLSSMGLLEASSTIFSQDMVWHWMSVVLLQLGLRLVTSFKAAELVTPLYVVIIPAGFYFLLWTNGVGVEKSREDGWLFPRPRSSHAVLGMWELFDISRVDWSAVSGELGTMLWLSLFLLLLVPVRVPTLAVATGEDVDFDKEIKAHGVANVVAGLAGSVQNYLSYSNSVFYYCCGGRGRLAQWTIFAFTFALYFLAPWIVTYTPRCVAGCVLVTLGWDLLKDTLWDSSWRLDGFEYGSVLTIAVVATALGFVPGVAVGGVLTCATFVIQASRSTTVRAVFAADSIPSNSRFPWGREQQRGDEQERDRGRRKVQVLQMEGNVFFANVKQIVDSVKATLRAEGMRPRGEFGLGGGGAAARRGGRGRGSMQYVLLDLSFVTTMDEPALEELLVLEKGLLEDWEPAVEIAFAGMDAEMLDHLSVLRRRQETGAYFTGSLVKPVRVLPEGHDHASFRGGSSSSSDERPPSPPRVVGRSPSNSGSPSPRAAQRGDDGGLRHVHHQEHGRRRAATSPRQFRESLADDVSISSLSSASGAKEHRRKQWIADKKWAHPRPAPINAVATASPPKQTKLGLRPPRLKVPSPRSSSKQRPRSAPCSPMPSSPRTGRRPSSRVSPSGTSSRDEAATKGRGGGRRAAAVGGGAGVGAPGSGAGSEDQRVCAGFLKDQAPEGASAAALARLGRLFEIQEIDAGKVLWRGGEKADIACLLLSGCLCAVAGGRVAVEGAEGGSPSEVAETIKPGMFVGISGLLVGTEHPLTIAAEAKSKVAIISGVKVQRMVHSDTTGLAVLQAIALKNAHERSIASSIPTSSTTAFRTLLTSKSPPLGETNN